MKVIKTMETIQVERIAGYEAKDGSIFPSESICREYENFLYNADTIKEKLSLPFSINVVYYNDNFYYSAIISHEEHFDAIKRFLERNSSMRISGARHFAGEDTYIFNPVNGGDGYRGYKITSLSQEKKSYEEFIKVFSAAESCFK
jgi:hypothetical protein